MTYEKFVFMAFAVFGTLFAATSWLFNGLTFCKNIMIPLLPREGVLLAKFMYLTSLSILSFFWALSVGGFVLAFGQSDRCAVISGVLTFLILVVTLVFLTLWYWKRTRSVLVTSEEEDRQLDRIIGELGSRIKSLAEEVKSLKE